MSVAYRLFPGKSNLNGICPRLLGVYGVFLPKRYSIGLTITEQLGALSAIPVHMACSTSHSFQPIAHNLQHASQHSMF